LVTFLFYSNAGAETTEILSAEVIEKIARIDFKDKKQSLKKEKNHGFSGQFSYKGSLGSSDKSFGAGFKWKPDAKDYYYAKFGLKHDLSDVDDKQTFSWGVGYDDWHEGTLTAQINHWGGIKLNEGFDSYNAIGSLGYKINSNFLKKNKLKAAVSISKRLGGNSEFKTSASLGWSPLQYWTIKGILVKPLNGDKTVWNYLIGYDDWHPNTFGIEYSNYNPNSLYETTFKENGKLTITYKWSW
jgi:hypothetical protein